MTEKLNWGIVGTASIARRRFVPGIKKADKAELVAVASRSFEKAQAFASEFDIPTAYGDYQQLLDDPSIQAVYIPLPNHLHAEWVIKAARTGKHILCEKPLGVDPEECRRMIDACTEAGVLLMEGFMYRLHPRTIMMKKLLDEGKIGEPKTIISASSHLRPKEGDIRFTGEKGSGVLMDVGIYCVNAARYLFDGEPVAVFGWADFIEPGQVDVTFRGVLEFSRGRMAMFDSSYEISYRQYMEVGGTEGALFADRPFVPGDSAKCLEFTTQGSMDVECVEVAGADQFQLEINAFSEAAMNGLPSPLNPEDAVQNMRVIKALLESARLGRRIELLI